MIEKPYANNSVLSEAIHPAPVSARYFAPASELDRAEPHTAVMLSYGICLPNRNESIGRLTGLIDQATNDPTAILRARTFRSKPNAQMGATSIGSLRLVKDN